MSTKKIKKTKTRLHPRNRNRDRYDLEALVEAVPELEAYIKLNKYGRESIDFSESAAVKLLNRALLSHYYGIKRWEFPDTNLCPPIPGRADYIHYIADLLLDCNQGDAPKGSNITCFDLGVGANCIYPIVGVTEYKWKFIASDIDPKSLKAARHIINVNPSLKGNISCRLQEDSNVFFKNVLREDEKVDVTICNPPFHGSVEEAQREAKRKVENLSGKKGKKLKLNFAGISNELIYEGGEFAFITKMIKESVDIGKQCYWFSTLVSKQAHLKGIYELLEEVDAHQVETLYMGTGNKFSRIVAWTFLSDDEQRAWRVDRWGSSDAPAEKEVWD
ncbi:MAG: 23S rRNA (adenine(1618)-N(6))-methyltransferase RlmF [Bacteroidia bacterium]